MNAKQAIAFLEAFNRCVQRAADSTSRERQLAELRDCIARQEREHRAFGRRLVGDIGARMSVRQACDYFVARVLVQGVTTTRVSQLDGMRDDYVRGAILIANKPFRAALRSQLRRQLKMSEREAFARVAEMEYPKLVSD